MINIKAMMHMSFHRYFILIMTKIILILYLSALPGFAAEVRISAASNLTDLLRALTIEYNKKHPETTAQFIFGASGSPDKPDSPSPSIDIYVTATPGWMKYLVEQGKIFPGSVENLALNTLVVIGPKDQTIESITDISSFSHIAIANPKNSLSGQYAEQILKSSKLYDNFVKNDILVIAKDIKQVLTFVDRGEISAAIIFQTESLNTKNSSVIFSIPDKLYDKIAYPVALTHAGDKNERARMFYSFILSPAVSEILKKKGFTAPVRDK